MNIRRRIFNALTALAVGLSLATMVLADGTLVRWHEMGEFDGGSDGATVSLASDTPIDFDDATSLDLSPISGPVYRNIVGRPDGGSGVGIEFVGASQQYLVGPALNWPQQSGLDQNFGGHLNLMGIADRGFEFWVRPTSSAAQSIVMDTNLHGVRIDASGKFSMRYIGADYASTVTATPNTWYHIQVVRPEGEENGARMYINGSAAVVAVPPFDYPADASTPLMMGSNIAGNGEFFSGIIDDFRMYVFGISANPGSVNFGTFNLLTDNSYVASPVSGLSGVPGDVDNDGFLTEDDKDDFVAGWLSKRLVNGVQIGDMTSHAQGDLNLDGITNIYDLATMQAALVGGGMSAITDAQLFGVPEPTTLALILFGLFAIPLRLRRMAS